MNHFIENQNWRYATKKYDPTRKISDADFQILKEAIRLSPSSYGLQPYKVLVVETADLREQLKSHAWNQSQITDASHLIVFANETGFGDSQIDRFVSNVAATRGIPIENLAGYGNFMKSKLTPLEASAKNSWTARQAYLALGNLISAAAELRIDVTPMEGFEAEAFDDLLQLNDKGLSAAVVAAVGYRHADDQTQFQKKVRKSEQELFITL